MDQNQQYRDLISEVIAKQSVILGPDIAVIKARSVGGLMVDDNGKVIGINGEPEKVLEELINAYVALSGQIVKSALSSIFTKYPGINTKENA